MEEMESILYEGKGHLIEFKESMSDSLAKGMVAFHVHILNPGGLVKGISPDEFGLISISRNQFLQGLFHRANLVERIGSGIGRMGDKMKTVCLSEPEFNWNGFFGITQEI
ncbi:MAG TPA: hypothetical protein ENF23_00595 [Methanosarcinales archaeon]|nr:MAG: hypothetical protein DRO03_00705 [Methanosarcinales archaeon]HDN64791.1 hypothetical protein [Methanosarcinales archaeon]